MSCYTDCTSDETKKLYAKRMEDAINEAYKNSPLVKATGISKEVWGSIWVDAVTKAKPAIVKAITEHYT